MTMWLQISIYKFRPFNISTLALFVSIIVSIFCNVFTYIYITNDIIYIADMCIYTYITNTEKSHIGDDIKFIRLKNHKGCKF